VIRIDEYAYLSPLRDVHPGEKIFFSLSTMLLVLAMDSVLISGIVLVGMSLIIVWRAGVDYGYFLKLLSIPIGFLLLGCLAVLFSVSLNEARYDHFVRIGAVFIGVTSDSVWKAVLLFTRSIAAVVCLYMLILTTPVNHIICILQRVRMPAIIINLMVLIYNNIFVFVKSADEIYIAQVSRYGYHGWSGQIRSLSLLCNNLFVKSLKASNDAFNGMISRGFDGELKIADEVFETKAGNIAATVILNCLLITIYLSGRV